MDWEKNRYSAAKTCPCGKDNRDGKFAPLKGYSDKGYCHSCGETFAPAKEKPLLQSPQYRKPEPPAPQDFISLEQYVTFSENNKDLFKQNNFIHWLWNKNRDCPFDFETTQELTYKYLLGNSGRHPGYVTFPYIDINGRVTDVKAINYDRETGKRIKVPFSQCFFIGKQILGNDFANLSRSFYGEHLLAGNDKPVKVFESEATATYAAAFYPESVCIATGGKNGCKWTERQKSSVLKGRTVTLYPDIDAHEDWEVKAKILAGFGIDVKISLLIKNAAQKYAERAGINYSDLVKEKYDLRDILKYKPLPGQQKNEMSPEPDNSEDIARIMDQYWETTDEDYKTAKQLYTAL